ncbi:MAG TPA: helix-turn-helix transcriptional regulator [Ktedonobacteraceae bacterium]|nr:helix-turn-helix transcriptional regulator [Ktedonobacteraceae bacterium]
MTSNDLQQLKMAWLAAEDAGDKQAQIALLRDHPDAQDELIDFIAVYHMSAPVGSQTALLPLTQRAISRAFEHVFSPQSVVAAANLRDLRAKQGLTLVQAARGLRLGIDVWKKFEDGVIDLVSLSERHLERLARFFHISAEQFGSLLLQSQPLPTLDRRQTAQAARSSQQSRLPKQPFAEAIEKSAMTREEKEEWR